MVKNTFNSSTRKAHEGGSEFEANLTHSENLSQQQKQANYLYSYKKKKGGRGARTKSKLIYMLSTTKYVRTSSIGN